MSGRHMKRLLRAHRDGDELAFRRVALELVEEAEARRQLALARDLRAAIGGSGSTAGFDDVIELPSPPTDSDAGWPLVEVRHAARYLEDLVLAPQVELLLRELVDEVEHWPQLDRSGIVRRQRLLFHGPPGTGKTSTAEALAGALRLPLVVVRADAIVGSLLGQTASNLRRVFEYVERFPCVALFDEVDALAAARGTENEHGELRRAVTSTLTLLESYSGRGLVVAATNHDGLLDHALWRRFDEVVTFERPTVHEIRRLLRRELPGRLRDGVDIDGTASSLRGQPHAAVTAVVTTARRLALLEDRAQVRPADVDEAVRRARQRRWS